APALQQALFRARHRAADVVLGGVLVDPEEPAELRILAECSGVRRHVVFAEPAQRHQLVPEGERQFDRGHYANSAVAVGRSITISGTRAAGPSRRRARTSSAQSSGWISSSLGRPFHSAIGVSTKPG